MGLFSSIRGSTDRPPPTEASEADVAEKSRNPKLQGESLVHNPDRPNEGNSFVLVGNVDALNRAWRAKMGMSS